MSTLLAKAISLKSLMQQLSKHEFLAFMAKLFDVNYCNVISLSLFNHFTASIPKQNLNHLDVINCILSEIIESRKIKPKPLAMANMKLNKVPKALLGHIASFLDQSNYFEFEKTNRCIFIACNSPNMLSVLNLLQVEDYSNINLSQFKSVKELKIKLANFQQLAVPQNGHLILNNLQYLTLHGKHLNDIDIEPFLQQKCLNIAEIIGVQFVRFGKGFSSFNVDKFLRLLAYFKNIEYLSFFSIILSDTLSTQKLSQFYASYPLLKGLGVCGGNASVNNNLVNIFGDNLQLLSYSYPPRDGFDFSRINFSKLQQIMLETAKFKTIQEILKSAPDIAKICLFPDGYHITCPSAQDLKRIIPPIFACKALQYFEITMNASNYLSILNGIELALYQTKKWKRKEMKIRVNGKKNASPP